MTSSDLSFHVHVTDPVLEHGTPPVPHGYPSVASPMSSTLITGSKDAVLVDPPWAKEHVGLVGHWIASFERSLTAIYITHGHGDHWFGTSLLLERFPDAVVYATPQVIEYMSQQHETRAESWDNRFPGVIAGGNVIPSLIPSEGIQLEGNLLQAIDLGHTDTDDTTALWAPSIRLLVAGDAVYNHCHQYLNEAGGDGHRAWLRALDIVEALNPKYVVAGHKKWSQPDDPGAIQRTRTYLLAFEEFLDDLGLTPEKFFESMLQRFPDYSNPKALWRSIVARVPDRSPSTAQG